MKCKQCGIEYRHRKGRFCGNCRELLLVDSEVFVPVNIGVAICAILDDGGVHRKWLTCPQIALAARIQSDRWREFTDALVQLLDADELDARFNTIGGVTFAEYAIAEKKARITATSTK
jgi:hypothetical protein